MTDQRWTIRSGSVPALFWPDDENPDMPFSFTEADLAEMLPDALDRQVSAAFTALADALRAAEEEEVYRTALGLACSDGWSDGESAMESYIETAKAHIAALYGGGDRP